MGEILEEVWQEQMQGPNPKGRMTKRANDTISENKKSKT